MDTIPSPAPIPWDGSSIPGISALVCVSCSKRSHMTRFIVAATCLASSLFAAPPLVVISVDGLDNRYFASADEMGLKIPTLRRLMREGEYSQGVIGVSPTITWPSHTSLITGVDPAIHGIL